MDKDSNPSSSIHIPSGCLILVNANTNQITIPTLSYPPSTLKNNVHSFPFFPMTVFSPNETQHIPCYYPSSSDPSFAYEIPIGDGSTHKRKRLREHPTSEERVNMYLSKNRAEFQELNPLTEDEIREFSHICFVNQWRINISNTTLRRNSEIAMSSNKIFNKYKDKLQSGELNFESQYDWNKILEIRKNRLDNSFNYFKAQLNQKQEELVSLKTQCSKLPRVCLEMLLESKMAERGIAEYEILMAEKEFGRRDFIQQYYYEIELRKREIKKLYQTKFDKLKLGFEEKLTEEKNKYLQLQKQIHNLDHKPFTSDPYNVRENTYTPLKDQVKENIEDNIDKGFSSPTGEKRDVCTSCGNNKFINQNPHTDINNKEINKNNLDDNKHNVIDVNHNNEASLTQIKVMEDHANNSTSAKSIDNNLLDHTLDLSFDESESSLMSDIPDTEEMNNFLDFPRKHILDKEVYGKQKRKLNLLEKGGELGFYQILINKLKKTEIYTPGLIKQLLWLDETNANRCIDAPSQDISRDGHLYIKCLRLEIRLREKIEKFLRKSKKLKTSGQKFSEDEIVAIREELITDNRELYDSTLRLDNGRNNLQKTLKLHYAQINSRFNNFPPLKRGYRLLNMLGKGGFAEVWEVFDPLTCTIFAAKLHMLPADMNNQERNEVIKRVKNEIDIHKLCRSNIHIVDIKACFQMDENLLATILELCEDGDLDKYIKFHGPIPENLALVWAKQILTGLHHMKHLPEGRIHHCDLKPGNILRHRGILKLSDFGLSKMVQPNSESIWTGGGTAWYQAPECCYYNKKISIPLTDKIDIWAVGCILFEMLFAQRLFGGTHTQHKPMDKILKDAKAGIKFPDHPVISEECKNLMLLLLTFNHLKRPSIEEVLEHPLILNAEKYHRPIFSDSFMTSNITT